MTSEKIDMEKYKTECEYCGMEFSRLYYADKDKADHKRTCTEKRYLGGQLIIENETRSKRK